MAKIGSWWLKSVAAEPAEEVVWSQAANRLKDSGRAVGGKLFLTDRRLIFCPHWVDAATGGRPWQVPLERLAAIGTIPQGSPGGWIRDRLAIDLADASASSSIVSRQSPQSRRNPSWPWRTASRSGAISSMLGRYSISGSKPVRITSKSRRLTAA